ncbi:hypothetical protein AB4P32_26910, partial [Escherichia coli]
HITMSFTAYVPRPFQKTLWRPGGMLSMSFRHVLVAGKWWHGSNEFGEGTRMPGWCGMLTASC